jgi:hypothetical protein
LLGKVIGATDELDILAFTFCFHPSIFYTFFNLATQQLKPPAEIVTMLGDLPAETPIYNLFDGIITLTMTQARDPWVSDRLDF